MKIKIVLFLIVLLVVSSCGLRRPSCAINFFKNQNIHSLTSMDLRVVQVKDRLLPGAILNGLMYYSIEDSLDGNYEALIIFEDNKYAEGNYTGGLRQGWWHLYSDILVCSKKAELAWFYENGTIVAVTDPKYRREKKSRPSGIISFPPF